VTSVVRTDKDVIVGDEASCCYHLGVHAIVAEHETTSSRYRFRLAVGVVSSTTTAVVAVVILAYQAIHIIILIVTAVLVSQ
jgi:hypothetical protein